MARKRDDSKGLSIRAYAEHRRVRGLRGGTTKAIQKAMAAGRIRPNAHGKIDPRQADQEWERSTAPSPTAPVRIGSHQSGDLRGQTASPGQAEAAGRPDRVSYSQSRAVREAYDARLRKLDYETRLGRLVPADDVRLEAFRRARSVRDRMMGIPARVAGTLAEETDPHLIEQKLLETIALALETEASES
jgi:hypothetical protein